MDSPDIISFEHFDPQYELGNTDNNGKPIRPRKKPGRKPNPPSPAQRKAQNRAAQRAFRERKRREMREAEMAVKTSLHIRDQALKRVRRLNRKVQELTYETNYLRGQLLTYKLACVANRVDLPKFWDSGKKDSFGCDYTARSKNDELPQCLELYLDKYKNLVQFPMPSNIQQALMALMDDSSCTSASPPSTLIDLHDQETNGPPTISPSSSTSSQVAVNESKVDDILAQHLSSIAPQLADHLDSPFFQQLLQSNILPQATSPAAINQLLQSLQQQQAIQLQQRRAACVMPQSPEPALLDSPATPAMEDDTNMEDVAMDDPSTNIWLQQQNLSSRHLGAMLSASCHINDQDLAGVSNAAHGALYTKSLDDAVELVTEEPVEEYDGKTGLQRIRSHYPDTPDECPAASPEAPVSPNDNDELKNAPPMNPVDAIFYVRSHMNLGASIMTLWPPTELQRNVPHDARIDYVPGAVMRDLMIVYQNFYDANDLFNLLVQESRFMGGELGNPDRWVVPPRFLQQYWYLCPNHRPDRVDNMVELFVVFAQNALQHMMKRKEMYLDRDQFADEFPPRQENPVTPSTFPTDDGLVQPTAQDMDPTLVVPLTQGISFDPATSDFGLDDVMVLVDDFPKFMTAPPDLFTM
ncbi:hypothetical protein DM01DRAFT_1335653 [Hesseltinella vesiculosa]|uniref:BZIP domain-containing protein n=1 Tax=Hesseltinella vesiculosa TaxID=101127 RepID=A0A1X2GIH3_9FUNG|nr:hypothetical protein DM01DRAFT_1335653 [Hesseltinella vesiculosa]